MRIAGGELFDLLTSFFEFLFFHAAGQDHKLIAARPVDFIAGKNLAQDSRTIFQHTVSFFVAEPVSDLLQPVQVREDDTHQINLGSAFAELVNPVVHFIPVHNAGQHVHRAELSEPGEKDIVGNFGSDEVCAQLKGFLNPQGVHRIKIGRPDISEQFIPGFEREKHQTLDLGLHQRLIPRRVPFPDIFHVCLIFYNQAVASADGVQP